MAYEIINESDQPKIKVESIDLEEFFKDAFIGTMELINGSIPDDKTGISRHLSIKASDYNDLLVDFLNEIIFLAMDNKEIYGEVEFKELEDDYLEAELTGYEADSRAENIKGVYLSDEEEDESDSAGEYQTVLVYE